MNLVEKKPRILLATRAGILGDMILSAASIRARTPRANLAGRVLPNCSNVIVLAMDML